MKVCNSQHTVKAFGVIPVGSVWADDSPFLTDDNAANFSDVPEPTPEPAKPVKPVRKSNLRKASS